MKLPDQFWTSGAEKPRRAILGLGSRRPSLWWRQSTRRGLHLCTWTIRPICRSDSERLQRHLAIDDYAGYSRLLKRRAQDVQLAYCLTHARRKLHEVPQTGTTPIADEGLKHIGKLYGIYKDIRG